MGSMFGLGSRVTINALQDVVGGPPEPGQTFNHMPSNPQVTAWVDVSTRLKSSMVDDIDALEDDLDNNIPLEP